MTSVAAFLSEVILQGRPLVQPQAIFLEGRLPSLQFSAFGMDGRRPSRVRFPNGPVEAALGRGCVSAFQAALLKRGSG